MFLSQRLKCYGQSKTLTINDSCYIVKKVSKTIKIMTNFYSSIYTNSTHKTPNPINHAQNTLLTA